MAYYLSRRNFLRSIGTVAFGAMMTRTLHAYNSDRQSPNFVVILTDDQSWVGSSVLMDPGDLRTRSDYYQTPHIDRLAKMGMRFTQGYSPAPFCYPTRRSLLIGQTPARHIYQKDQENWPKKYRKQLTIPKMLKQANPEYMTAHFGKWDFRFDNVTPEEMGYDISDGYTGNFTGGAKGTGGPKAIDDPKKIFGITQRKCDFIEKQAQNSRPFFVQVSHYAVHLDIYYRQESLDKSRKLQRGRKHTMPEFAAMTSDVDCGIGKVIDKIKALDLQSNTYIFFMSDNGGRLSMPGQPKAELARNHPLRDGKGSMYEGGLRVPFIVIGPGVKAGGVSKTPVTDLDYLPTIADLAGYKKALPDSLDGGSMSNVIFDEGTGEVQRKRPFLLFHHAVQRKPQTALILGKYKLVKTWQGNKLELFDLSAGPSENDDLSVKLPDKTRELHSYMLAFLEEVNAETRRISSKKKGK
ncbi:sulfatase-like hydrolase/transferase [Planctomycetota bacterium]